VLGGLHERSARWNGAAHRPLSTEAGARHEPFTPSYPDALRHCSNAATCFWSKAIKTLPVSSVSDSNRLGRIRRCMSGRSPVARRKTATRMQYPILPKIALARSRQAMEQISEIAIPRFIACVISISRPISTSSSHIAKGFDYKSLQWSIPRRSGSSRLRSPRIPDALDDDAGVMAV
jgi:hypothetical protein